MLDSANKQCYNIIRTKEERTKIRKSSDPEFARPIANVSDTII